MRSSLSFSVRRHFVDEFFASHTDLYQAGSRVLDIGGRRHSKRGRFDINAYPCKVTYVNIEPSTEPDVIADAATLPLSEASFDLIILGELLEHVSDPAAVLNETYRVLRTNGTLLGTVPFIYPVHGDPSDHGRYTDQHLKKILAKAGYSNIQVEPQGSWYAVFALAIQAYFRFPSRNRLSRRLGKLLNPFYRLLLSRDRHAGPSEYAWTTGYGIIARKI